MSKCSTKSKKCSGGIHDPSHLPPPRFDLGDDAEVTTLACLDAAVKIVRRDREGYFRALLRAAKCCTFEELETAFPVTICAIREKYRALRQIKRGKV